MTAGTTQYRCDDPARAIEIRAHPSLNGIDYLEVLDDDAPPGAPPQRTLLAHCFKPVPPLTSDNVQIEGGVRVTGVGVTWVSPAASVPSSVAGAAERSFYAELPDADRVLVVRTDSSGDYSPYRLTITEARSSPALTKDFDAQLSTATFSFKVDCPSEFDCCPADECPAPTTAEPQIDYTAKDYASFRRIILDRLALVAPGWTERSPADVGVALVELLAYEGDHLSYFQDAVATEAYLGTARQRISVRRHGRLLDYRMHDGANARAWVQIAVDAPAIPLPAGTPLLTTIEASRGSMDPHRLEAAVSEGALVFETLFPATLREAHNEIRFHTWGDNRCCLPSGSTRATLLDTGHVLEQLAPGDVLIFEERRDPDSGRTVDANPAHRHAVRLTEVTFGEDPAVLEEPGQPQRVAEVAWAVEDALPFPLCLWMVGDQSGVDQPVSVALGNVVLADHGQSRSEALEVVPPAGPFGPVLVRGPLTQQRMVTDRAGDLLVADPGASATAAFPTEMEQTRPHVQLTQPGAGDLTWVPRADLLGSDRFATEFVVEVDDRGLAHLRFGDDELGRRPAPGTLLRADYRVGNGLAGNVGAEAIAHVVTTVAGITGVRNPMPASGGVDPQPADQVRMFAPQAFRRQERAVTVADYADIAQRHPEVQRAAATRRWTGSWYTVFVTVDRMGGRDVDPDFRAELLSFMSQYRLAGYDLEIDEPRFIPLDIAFTVCVSPGHLRSDVKAELLRVLGSGELPDGRGFFHPDNFTFGDPVYLSRLVAAAMRVPGVVSVDYDDTPPKPNRFHRWGELPHGETNAGRIDFGRLEIARLDNDPSRPENGRLELFMQGGL